MQRLVITLVKLGLSFSILTYLVTDIHHQAPDTFADLFSRPKRWDFLFGSLSVYLCALIIGIFRWQLLLRVLQLPIRFLETLRIAAFCYIVEILSIGLAGADAARATMLSRAVPGRVAPAIVSVAVDRIIGGYVLICYVSINAWLLQPTDLPVQAAVHTLQLIALTLTSAGILWIAIPNLAPSLARAISGFGSVGRFVSQLLEAMNTYRNHLPALALAAVITVGVMLLSTTTFFLLANGLPGGAPTWREHSVIVPLLLLSALVPLPMQGLGVVDYTLSYLYQHIPAQPPHVGQGLIVAMGIRLVSISIGTISGIYYALAPSRIDSTVE